MIRFRRTAQHKQKFARILREYPTHAERRLWESLRATDWGNEVLRQQRILGWIADLHFARQGLVVEIDGPYHETRLLTDLHRDRIMEGRGLRVLRIPSEMVARNEPDIMAQIRLALTLETTPDLPLGAKLWQHLRDRSRRDLTAIHRINQRMYIARHLWEGPALHLQWLTEAGFRTAAEVEFVLPEHSELWLTGWDFIQISHNLQNDSPDLLFLREGEVIAGLLLLPAQDLKRFLEEQRAAWSDYPYPCLIAPVNEELYRSERPWHYGNPLPVLQTILGTLTESPKRLYKPIYPYHIKPPTHTKNDELSEQNDVPSEQKDIPSEQNDVPSEQTNASSEQNNVPSEQNDASSEQNNEHSEQNDASSERTTTILLDVDGWPMELHAFRVVDLYFAGGERTREIFWVIPDPARIGGAILLAQSDQARIAEAPPPYEEAISQLSEAFRQHLLYLQSQKILVDSPMRWQKLSAHERRHLQRTLSLGHFPPRYLWSESAKNWEQPRYARNLRWGGDEEKHEEKHKDSHEDIEPL
jgi:very-short-patch-repair endonuclease